MTLGLDDEASGYISVITPIVSFGYDFGPSFLYTNFHQLCEG